MKQIAATILTLRSSRPFSIGKKLPATLNYFVIIFLLLVLFVAEIIRVYLVMPFPGSQHTETVDIAWWISTYIFWIRLLILSLTGIALVRVLRNGKQWQKIALPVVLAGYLLVFLLFNYRLDAGSIFQQPAHKSFVAAPANYDRNRLVIGVLVNGEAKAYPIQLLGYHHQVIDTVGNMPLMVTYCTVCRSGRVYSTTFNGRAENFRLVGMDHFNAVFEDATTGSWWQQANGKAIAGPLKGAALKEIPSFQSSLGVWMRQNPSSVVMAPDPTYEDRYFRLEDYDKGTMESGLVKRDFQAWHAKSWVIGIRNDFSSATYDWNNLVLKRMIQDSLPSLPLLLVMEADTISFHAYDRRVNGLVLQFDNCIAGEYLTDQNTHSTWDMDGLCTGGPLKGNQMSKVQAYNEFLHSWESFQPNAKQYAPR